MREGRGCKSNAKADRDDGYLEIFGIHYFLLQLPEHLTPVPQSNCVQSRKYTTEPVDKRLKNINFP